VDSRIGGSSVSGVVAGVDGAGRSRAAIQLAAREARYRDTRLIAVMAYSGTAYQEGGNTWRTRPLS
jgi:hypothetical protein